VCFESFLFVLLIVQWKAMFGEKYRLRRNWLKGYFNVRTFEGHTQGEFCFCVYMYVMSSLVCMIEVCSHTYKLTRTLHLLHPCLSIIEHEQLLGERGMDLLKVLWFDVLDIVIVSVDNTWGSMFWFRFSIEFFVQVSLYFPPFFFPF